MQAAGQSAKFLKTKLNKDWKVNVSSLNLHLVCLTQVLSSRTFPVRVATASPSMMLCRPALTRVLWSPALISCMRPLKAGWIGAMLAGWVMAQCSIPSLNPESLAVVPTVGLVSETMAAVPDRASLTCSAFPLHSVVGFFFKYLFSWFFIFIVQTLLGRKEFFYQKSTVRLLTACFSAVRTFLLAGPTWQADLWRGCAGMLGWWCRDCQGGPHVRSLECPGLRSLRRWLAGWRKCPLSHLQAPQELQPHRSCGAFRWIPRQNAEVLRRLLLQGSSVRGQIRVGKP